jgi:glycosyltransferase involved in cell wall biosynthesis
MGVVDDRERSWNLLEFLRDRVPDEGVRDRIEWLGQLPNSTVMDLRRRSLVSVVASRYDNFPTTVTEAIAMGCPIVAPATGGILEQIKHDVSGLLCRPNDPVDLAGQIGRLLADPVLAERLGRRARLDCEAMLSPPPITRDRAAFYCRVRERANAVGTRRR